MAMRFWKNRGLGMLAGVLGAGLFQTLLFASPSFSAERIYASLGPLERHISIEALETYARTGEIPNELQAYIRAFGRYITPEQLEELRPVLLVSAEVDVVTVAQFLYTTQGEAILDWLGEVIQTAGRQNGSLALRAAMIQAAADPDGGLNAINVLKHFPTQGPRVDLWRLLTITQVAIAEINQTYATSAEVADQATQAALESGQTHSPASSNVLASPGNYQWEKRVFGTAVLPTDLYLPEGENRPLVVISHGLGNNRATLAYVAEHLASHGFAAAVVEHPGSNASQIDSLLNGRVNEAIAPDELIRRPTSVQSLLDQLEVTAQRDPLLRGRIDFARVGMLGQSLGAYTTLALAGAKIDLNSLERSCPPQIRQLNLSLLLQCMVPSLPQPLPTLQDSRVQAAFAINPLNSAVFGPEGLSNITVPIMMVSGSQDTVTPALAEQIRPFTWLKSPERYLLMMEGGTHFSTIFDPAADEETIPLPEVVIGPSPELAKRYIQIMSLAFFKTHLAGEDNYRQYLDPSFTAAISHPELPLSLVRDLTLAN